MDTIESLLAAADAKVAELTDDCSDADAQRIESEHAAIIDRIEALKASDRAPPQSAKDVRGLQNLADRGGIRQLTDAWIDQGLTREEITRRMLDELSRRGDTTGPIITSVGNAMQNARTLDNPNNRRQAIEDALYARMSGKEPEGASREFVGRSIRELSTLVDGAGWLEQRAGGMHTTSDFPVLLTAAGNRVLQDAYLAAQSPLRQLARVRSSADFRAINILRLSEAPTLEKVDEAGEVTYGSRGEESEAFRIETFARIFSLSRQAIINDDLGGFADFVTAMSRAAAEREALQLLALFTANSGNGATLKDGNPLFHASRGNKAASGTGITVDALSAARKALRETKGIDGKTPVGLTPRYLLVGPAKETEAEQALTAIMANVVAEANPFASKLELMVEPRWSGNSWAVFADTAQQQVISVAYLDGARGPMLEQRPGWTTLGTEFRAVLDFGAGVTDTRGAFLNPGD